MSAYQAPKHGFRTFSIIWATQSVSVMGTAVTVFAMNIFLAQVLFPLPEQKPQLALALTLFNLANVVPMVLMAPLAGAWADRHDRKLTMFYCDLINGVISMLAVFLMLNHLINLPLLLLFAVAYGVLGSFHGSAFDTAYAMLVPDEQLPRANGMMQTSWTLSGLVGPGLAAVLIGLPAMAQHGAWGGIAGRFLAAMGEGTPLALSVDSISFFLAAAVLPFLYVPSPKRADLGAGGKPKRPLRDDIKEGMVYIWHRRPLLWLLGTFTMANMLAPFGIIVPLMGKFNLAADWLARGFTYETAMAALNTANSAGAVLAGVAVTLWGGLKRNRVYGVVVALGLEAVLQTVFGWQHGLYAAAAAIFLVGLTFPVANVHSQAIWQTQVPRELQGRVFAVRRVIAQASGPLGMTVAGWLASRFDPGLTLSVMGAVMAVVCLMQLFNPALLRVEDKEYLDRMARRQAAAANDL